MNIFFFYNFKSHFIHSSLGKFSELFVLYPSVSSSKYPRLFLQPESIADTHTHTHTHV